MSATRPPPGHPGGVAQAPGQGHAEQARHATRAGRGQPCTGRRPKLHCGQPGHRVWADADVAARPPHQHQHGAQHDAAEHDCRGAHHSPGTDHLCAHICERSSLTWHRSSRRAYL